MERTEKCENVEGRNPQDIAGEEHKAPRDTQDATQSRDHCDVSAGFCIACVGSPETAEPANHRDEGSEGEEEDQRIVAYVDDVVDVTVGDPASWKGKVC